MSTLRAFIAIEIPASIQAAIARGVEPLKITAGKSTVRWVSPENIHLTLKFLGDVSSANLDVLKQILIAEVGKYTGFEIRVGSLGCYPNPRHPRVIWVGLQAPPELASLQQGVDSATAKLGYPPEDRAFSPHLTVGRVREQVSPADMTQLRNGLESITIGQIGSAHVSAVHFFKSDLQPGGAVYTRLFSAPLSS